MFKLIKVLVLLAILVCAGVGLYMWSQTKRAPEVGAPEQVRARESDKPRVEEKYGFTSEGAGGP